MSTIQAKINPRSFVCPMQPVIQAAGITGFEATWDCAPIRHGHLIYLTNRHMALRINELEFRRYFSHADTFIDYNPCFHPEGICDRIDAMLSPEIELSIDHIGKAESQTLERWAYCSYCNGTGQDPECTDYTDPSCGCVQCDGTGLGDRSQTIYLASNARWAATYVAAMMRAVPENRITMTPLAANGARLLMVRSATINAVGCIANIHTGVDA